jgi:predicted negative regulator of RcsB-dependent stress response
VRAEARHQLKQDRFATTTMETISWALEHRKNFVVGGIAAALVLAIGLGGWTYLQNQEQLASADLGRALRTFDAQVVPPGTPPQPGVQTFSSVKDRAQAAQPEFRRIAAKYGLTRSGELARYFAALTDVDLGNTGAAEKELKEIAGAHNKDLAALAKLALASVYRNSGRDSDAIVLYKSLIEHPAMSVSKAQAQLELAAVYAVKQPQEAKKLYEQIAKDNPTNPAGQMASARLAELK